MGASGGVGVMSSRGALDRGWALWNKKEVSMIIETATDLQMK